MAELCGEVMDEMAFDGDSPSRTKRVASQAVSSYSDRARLQDNRWRLKQAALAVLDPGHECYRRPALAVRSYHVSSVQALLYWLGRLKKTAIPTALQMLHRHHHPGNDSSDEPDEEEHAPPAKRVEEKQRRERETKQDCVDHVNKRSRTAAAYAQACAEGGRLVAAGTPSRIAAQQVSAEYGVSISHQTLWRAAQRRGRAARAYSKRG